MASDDSAAGMKMLAPDFLPGDSDVICGHGRRIYSHIGNERFRQLVGTRIQEYSNTTSKSAKSQILRDVVATVRNNSPNGGFVKQDDNGQWYEVGDFLAREKTSQAFRDELSGKYKSSSETKKKRRQAGFTAAGAAAAEAQQQQKIMVAQQPIMPMSTGSGNLMMGVSTASPGIMNNHTGGGIGVRQSSGGRPMDLLRRTESSRTFAALEKSAKKSIASVLQNDAGPFSLGRKRVASAPSALDNAFRQRSKMPRLSSGLQDSMKNFEWGQDRQESRRNFEWGIMSTVREESTSSIIESNPSFDRNAYRSISKLPEPGMLETHQEATASDLFADDPLMTMEIASPMLTHKTAVRRASIELMRDLDMPGNSADPFEPTPLAAPSSMADRTQSTSRLWQENIASADPEQQNYKALAEKQAEIIKKLLLVTRDQQKAMK